MMNLTNFEEYIDDIILGRGKDYFLKGKVGEVIEIEPGQYTAVVYGSEDYKVTVTVNDQGVVVQSYCYCPYDYGDYCKHEVAVFYTLSEKKPQLNKSKGNIKDLLASLKREELVSLVLTITEEHPHIEKKLMMLHGSSKNEVKAAKKLIKEYINSAKVRGFIDWNRVAGAVDGANIVLEKAATHLENDQPKIAVALGLVVLAEIVGMIQYCDDSSGYVGDVISRGLHLITKAVENGSQLPATDQNELFQSILTEARHTRYDGWSDWRNSLLNACTYFCSNHKLRVNLDAEIQMMIDDLKEDNWSTNFEKEQLMLLQLTMMEQFDSEDQVNEFIKKNIQFKEFREKAIVKLLQQSEYDKVINLCFEGEKKDIKYPGTVQKWKGYRYKAYVGLGDKEMQKELGKSLLLQDDFNYLHILKELYSLSEWNDVLKDITIIFEESYPSETYVKILIAENLFEKLLSYCERKPYEIERLYSHLISDYHSEVANIFIFYIGTISEKSSKRSDYKKVCKVIKTFKKACGNDRAYQLINELQDKYPRRPAFLDELRKIK